MNTGIGEGRKSRPRADALLNRERIRAAACEAFAQQGPDVSLDEIARRAGIGNATLYRHFTNRRELVRTTVLSLLSHTADRAEDALATELPPMTALRHFVHRALDEHFGALCPMLADCFDARDRELCRARSRVVRAISNLVQAAQHSGRLRPDVTVTDLTTAVARLARPLAGPVPEGSDHCVHRHVEVLLDGFST
ncbi:MULTISPECIES: TetR/AcrR family transcriptional regulator [unclassified Streptomyces]|uniref:TetR/AcrR family transcriptional regulator n=1 Tax=unclassified Streptomyces TaxID=2593676 RepID=UPI002E2F06A8|nr:MULTISPECIES: TetR/AcrR family transcriptional regulator [unclassified Streptomyces]